MKDHQAKVHAFHTAMGGKVGVPFSADLLSFRRKLIDEEVQELYHEIDAGLRELAETGSVSRETHAKLLKEMADVQYVLLGMAVTFGLPAGEAFDRVHISNMSKLDNEGRPVLREDGKVIKGPNYQPPQLEDLVA